MTHREPRDPFLCILVGPTASGKSRCALELAEELRFEIVGADSQQVYRHFDVGTAKPSAQEQARVPHHLISVVEPSERFSAAAFQRMADEAIDQVRARGRLPLVVGGTGLYVRALLSGLISVPEGSAEIRDRHRAIWEEDPKRLWQQLQQVDPASAQRLPTQDLMRVSRALEIFELTGRIASEARREHHFLEPRYRFRFFYLEPGRPDLYSAIDARTERMFGHGLIEEVEALVARGFEHAAPMRSVGYSQALRVVRREQSAREASAEAAQATRHYAKRQLTWFRKEARRLQTMSERGSVTVASSPQELMNAFRRAIQAGQ